MSIRDDLKAFVDGELPPDRMEQVRLAVQSDPALAEEVEFMRLLGREIKRLAPEYEIAGREKAIGAVTSRGWPWWHPYSLTGRLMAAGACAAVLLAVLYPVFFGKAHFASVAMSNQTESSAEPSQAPGRSSEAVEDAVGGGGAGKELVGGRKSVASSPEEMSEPDSRIASTENAAQGREEPPSRTTDVPLPERNRMVIQNADIARRVDDVEEAVNAARAMTTSLGGYVESQTTGSPQDRLPTATMVLRIPSNRFEEALAQLRTMGEKVHENTNADDVTRQYADLEGRIRVLRAEEESYVTMLRGARRIGEIIEIKDRLSRVRQELASYEQQRLMLKDLSALSTINVRFEQRVAVGTPEEPKNWAEDAWATAVNGLSAVGRFLAKAAIFAFVFAPVWVPPLALFWWLGKRVRA